MRIVVAVLIGAGLPPPAGAAEWERLPDLAHARAAVAPRIFNGTPTSDHPAVAAVGVQLSAVEFGLCSGTLVAPAVVLTAAHCVDRRPLRVLAAFLVDGRQENHAVDAFVMHPRHVPGTPIADVALLRLAAPVQGVAPVPLARARPRPGRTGTIVGFGEDGSGEVGRPQAGTVRLARCPAILRRVGLHPRRLLCWRADRGGSNTCEGDSGGPLLVRGAVAGITSGGVSAGCGPGPLSFNSSVPAYRRWIAAQLR